MADDRRVSMVHTRPRLRSTVIELIGPAAVGRGVSSDAHESSVFDAHGFRFRIASPIDGVTAVFDDVLVDMVVEPDDGSDLHRFDIRPARGHERRRNRPPRGVARRGRRVPDTPRGEPDLASADGGQPSSHRVECPSRVHTAPRCGRVGRAGHRAVPGCVALGQDDDGNRSGGEVLRAGALRGRRGVGARPGRPVDPDVRQAGCASCCLGAAARDPSPTTSRPCQPVPGGRTVRAAERTRQHGRTAIPATVSSTATPVSAVVFPQFGERAEPSTGGRRLAPLTPRRSARTVDAVGPRRRVRSAPTRSTNSHGLRRRLRATNSGTRISTT